MAQILYGAVYTLVALFLLTDTGNRACRLLFRFAGMTAGAKAPAAREQRAGRIIGGLERLTIAIGILTHSWEVLAAVIALKTVGRFKELDDKTFAEYFLVGSLFSVLWAVFVTSLWLVFDRHFGINLRAVLSGDLAAG
ncbi:hypothetical protein FGG78_40105 [Thioclava sp. BHET1]|nr:hypothetical protein FGG78_40105 [Thioclava sp. BHET1]